MTHKAKPIKWINSEAGLCVMCDRRVGKAGHYVCLSCNRPCEVDFRKLGGDPQAPRTLQLNAVLFLADLKSRCCNYDVEVLSQITCSDDCHEDFVVALCAQFGEFKKIVGPDGVARKVPTRTIIEKGLRTADLKRFPAWSDQGAA